MIIPTREAIVAAARAYIGTPFRMLGRSHEGIDCVGLLYCVGTGFGYEIADRQDYSRNPEVKKLNDALDAYTDPASLSAMKAGQIVKLRQAFFPMHTGIMAKDEHGRLTIINANISKRMVVEELMADWRDLVMAVREFRGVC